MRRIVPWSHQPVHRSHGHGARGVHVEQGVVGLAPPARSPCGLGKGSLHSCTSAVPEKKRAERSREIRLRQIPAAQWVLPTPPGQDRSRLQARSTQQLPLSPWLSVRADRRVDGLFLNDESDPPRLQVQELEEVPEADAPEATAGLVLYREQSPSSFAWLSPPPYLLILAGMAFWLKSRSLLIGRQPLRPSLKVVSAILVSMASKAASGRLSMPGMRAVSCFSIGPCPGGGSVCGSTSVLAPRPPLPMSW